MKNKDKILDIINSKSCGITAKGISIIFGESIDKTTIYRNIDKLLIDGVILEDFSKTGEKLYSIKEKHHHHFVCNLCNKKEDIGCFINSEIEQLEKKNKFIVQNHSLMLDGVCSECIK